MSDYQNKLFNGNIVKIGTFFAPPDGPGFHDTGPIGGHLIVFPRVPVLITHTGGRPIAANPNLVLFYNHGQEYRRDALAPEGDRCHWLGFGEETIRDVLQLQDASVQDRLQRPFLLTHGPSNARNYALQRRLVEYLLQSTQPDPIFVEETALAVLASSIHSSYQAWTGFSYAASTRNFAEREIAHAVESVLIRRLGERLTLGMIGAEVQYSPFHLSRVFFQQTGQTLHQYLNQLRLRTAYERILAGEEDLSRLALDLGFSSHSHFTAAFGKAFGMQPSAIRPKNILAFQKTASF